MRTTIGDIWKLDKGPLVMRGIPTNGTVTKYGLAVMGNGVALQAKQRYPGIDKRLGDLITRYGNHLFRLPNRLFTFPVKHHWRDALASLELIEQSVRELSDNAKFDIDTPYVLPLPGTGNGKLEPGLVWPLLQALPDNVTIVVLDKSYLPIAEGA